MRDAQRALLRLSRLRLHLRQMLLLELEVSSPRLGIGRRSFSSGSCGAARGAGDSSHRRVLRLLSISRRLAVGGLRWRHGWCTGRVVRSMRVVVGLRVAVARPHASAVQGLVGRVAATRQEDARLAELEAELRLLGEDGA